MSNSAVPPEEHRVRLTNVETLLNQAINDLVGSNSQALGMRCGAILAQAYSELQLIAGGLSRSSIERERRAAIEQQLRRVLFSLAHAERLLASAAEFYRGWCAAGFNAKHPVQGYENSGSTCGPSLLAFEG